MHEDSVRGVAEAHSRREKAGQRQNAVPRQGPEGCARRRRQERDLRRGIEAESEEESDGVHARGGPDPRQERSEEVQEGPAGRGWRGVSRPSPAADKPSQVQTRDRVEEERRDERAEDAAEAVEDRAGIGHEAVQAVHRESEGRREHEDDRRVTEREPEADARRRLADVAQPPRRVVDRGDMVGVESVAHAERIGGKGDAEGKGGTAGA